MYEFPGLVHGQHQELTSSWKPVLSLFLYPPSISLSLPFCLPIKIEHKNNFHCVYLKLGKFSDTLIFKKQKIKLYKIWSMHVTYSYIRYTLKNKRKTICYNINHILQSLKYSKIFNYLIKMK